MRNPLKPSQPIILLNIQSQKAKPLFRVYRDYLIFINLIRELAQSHQHKIYAFSWLHNDAWFLCQPHSKKLIKQLFRLLQRYYLWLQHFDNACEAFTVRAIKLADKPDILDALRFVHSRATASGQVQDALDYHWHSYPIYNEFWQLQWLDTRSLLAYFSTNQIIALNEFRKHMQYPCDLDFMALLDDQTTQEALYPHLDYSQPQSLITEPHHPYLTEVQQLQACIQSCATGLQVAFENS